MMPALPKVLSVRRVSFQILWPVVTRLMIQVVDHLTRKKWAPKLLFHHEDVLQNVPILPRSWMRRHANQNVAFPRLDVPAPLPVGVLLPN